MPPPIIRLDTAELAITPLEINLAKLTIVSLAAVLKPVVKKKAK